ncbi:MAG: hypothetical protein ACTSRR_06740 [Candidatus Heimdallarchaeaceae archaeon]
MSKQSMIGGTESLRKPKTSSIIMKPRIVIMTVQTRIEKVSINYVLT